MECPVCKARQPDDATVCSICEEPLTPLTPSEKPPVVPPVTPSAAEAVPLPSPEDEILRDSEEAVPGSSAQVFFLFGLLLLLLAAVGGGTLWQLLSERTDTAPAPVSVTEKTAPAQQQPAPEPQSTDQSIQAEDKGEIAARRRVLISALTLPKEAPQGLGALRLATVTIETPWGPVSGFLLDGHHLITASVAVKPSERKKQWAQQSLSRAEKWVVTQQQRVQFLEGKGDPGAAAARTRLQQGEKNARLWRQLVTKLSGGLTASDYMLRFADGSRRPVTRLVHGTDYPLTMVEFSGTPLPALAPEPARLARDFNSEAKPGTVSLVQNARIYTLGERKAATELVQGRLVNWFDSEAGRSYLRVAIDPPGSFTGGPMVARQSGLVLGINTLCRQTESGSNFCFVAPLGQVYNEFQLEDAQ